MPEHQQIQQSKKPDPTFQKQATPSSPSHESNTASIIQRARINPKSMTSADVMQLQRSIGNRAVGKLLSGIGNPSTAQQAPVQRQEIPEEEEPIQGKMIDTVQCQGPEEEEELLQGKFTDECVQCQVPEEEEELLQGKMIETIQRQENPEEEELIQGKFETVQRQESEEEELIQGKMVETIQRQEPEEEELIQGKMVGTIQRQESPEEEELLQGKMIETIQRQGPEEEELLQGKFAPAQKQEIQKDDKGQWNHPGEITEIQGNLMATNGYGDNPLYVVPDKGDPQIVNANTGNHHFPEATKFTEYPIQKKENHTGMPDGLKSGIESLSGIDLDDVKVHYNSSQPAQLNALAYAQGSDIHVAPGQEHNLPHEAWHVVQQAQGRVKPTMQLKDGVPVNDDKGLEHEADVMGGKAAEWTGLGAARTGNLVHTGRGIGTYPSNAYAAGEVQRVEVTQMKWDHLFNDIPKTLQDVPTAFKRPTLDTEIKTLIALRDKGSNGQEELHVGEDKNATDFGLMSNSFRIAVNEYGKGSFDERGLREATLELWKNSVDHDVAGALGKAVEPDIKAWNACEKKTWKALGEHF